MLECSLQSQLITLWFFYHYCHAVKHFFYHFKSSSEVFPFLYFMIVSLKAFLCPLEISSTIFSSSIFLISRSISQKNKKKIINTYIYNLFAAIESGQLLKSKRNPLMSTINMLLNNFIILCFIVLFMNILQSVKLFNLYFIW